MYASKENPVTPSSTVSASPPTSPHDRRSAVALGPHLGQPARLVERGHEEDVGSGHQPVLQPVGEVELHADAVGRGRGQLHQRRLVLLLAAAEEDELGVQREQLVRSAG